MSIPADDVKKRRPVVGIMTGSLHTENSSKISSAISEFFEKKDVDVRLYQGLDAKRYLDAGVYLDKGFDYHYYSLFGYSKFDEPDILIISFGTISAVTDPLSLQDFLSRLPDVPVVLLEDDTDIPNGIHVTIDNYQGMKACVEHLIDVHHYRDILFVSGPKGVPDACVRLRAFQDVMAEHGIPVREERVIFGDFTENVTHLVEEAIEQGGMPEAIACANDDMAKAVYRVVKSCGKTPGVDIAVTGFDNIPTSAYMDPPLATVYQNFREVSKTAVEKVLSFFSKDGDFKTCTLPARFLARQSCGCQMPEKNDEEEQANPFSDKVEGQRFIDNLKVDNIMSSLLIRNLFTEDISMSGFFENMGRQLALLNTKRSYICLLGEPRKMEERDKMYTPETMYMHLYQKGVSIVSYDEEDAPVIYPGDLAAYNTDEEKTQMATFLLFYGDIHYGVFCVELETSQMLFYYTLSLEIGSALRYLYLALDQKRTLLVLSEKNQILDYTASHDPLTGYLNRAGVMAESFAYMHEYRIGSHFIAVMADLDHLKQINDTFGHDAGDDAICTAAKALAAALPEGAPLGRTGGDEFTCLFECSSDAEAEMHAFRRRVKVFCDEVNETGGRPYYIGVSIGCFEFAMGEEIDLPTILKAADQGLYDAKKSRRKTVIK
ncbi:MAG: GGDEF domain-containing protein [Eubacterium sp.]|nr:GGDEF domain-containing protein [Eubacterium sp.]